MIYLMLIVLGLCFGSFVNALVWRIHQQSATSSKSKKAKTHDSKPDLSIINGRSICIHCKHKLAAKDLVPVLSWLSLGGKCRYCKKPISWQYPVVELITAVLFILSFIFWPESPVFSLQSSVNFIVWLVMLTGFMALIVYDLKWMILPNRIVYPMIVLALILAVFNILLNPGLGLLLQTIMSVAIAGGIFYLLFQLSSGRWIGGGDVKLGLLLGLLLQDPYKAFLTLLTASALGTLVIIPGMLAGKVNMKSRIPFGPFLIVACIIVYLFGGTAIDWYRQTILLI